MFKFYKPKLWLILTDLILISVNIFVVFRFFPLTTQNPIEKYFVPANVLIAAWLVVSYFFDRYNSIKSKSFIQSAFSLFFTSVIILVIFGSFILIQPASPYSQNVLISVLMGVFVSLYLFLFAYYLYRYAVTYDTPNLNPDKRLSAVPHPSHPMSDDAVTERYKRITEFSGEKVINYLQKNTMLYESGTYIFTEFNEKELEDIEHYQYSTYIQLKRLNHIRGINKMLALVNEKLPDNGILVCCYKSQSTIKQNGLYFLFSVSQSDAKILSDQAVVLRPYRRQKTGIVKNRSIGKVELLRIYARAAIQNQRHELCGGTKSEKCGSLARPQLRTAHQTQTNRQKR